MLEQDVILSKISIIKKCLKTIASVKENAGKELEGYLIDDITVLNLQRAIQAAIDTAHIIIADNGLELPATYKQSFAILAKQKIIPHALAQDLMKMVGFRNIAVHNYQQIDTEILHSICIHHLKDLEDFYTRIFKLINDNR